MKSQPSTTEQEPSETDPSTFAFAVTRIASAQICQSVGFTSARRSALDTLTDVAARYLCALARSAAAASASCGRTQSNLLDVVRSVEDLTSVHGFRGAWDPSRQPLASATLADLSSFVERTDEIPFAKPLPRPPSPERAVFTAKRTGVLHVPRWLPAFPEMREREIGGEERVKEEERSGVVGSFGKVDGGFLVDEKMKMGLLEKRGRVRFKMGLGVGRARGKVEGGGEVGEGLVGVDLRSGVCRGGKRVSCHQNRNVDNEEEDHRKKKRKKSSRDVSRNYI